MVAQLMLRELSARETIHQLAAKHGIAHQRAALDELGDAITNLSGDAVVLDETEWLLVTLDRAEVLKGTESTRLHHQYLKDRGY